MSTALRQALSFFERVNGFDERIKRKWQDEHGVGRNQEGKGKNLSDVAQPGHGNKQITVNAMQSDCERPAATTMIDDD